MRQASFNRNIRLPDGANVRFVPEADIINTKIRAFRWQLVMGY